MPPGTTTRSSGSGDIVVPHLERLVDFVEPNAEDVCLDVSYGTGPVPAALAPRVHHVTAVDATPAHEPQRVDGRTPTVLFQAGGRGAGGRARSGDPAPDRRDGGGPVRRSATVRADAAALPYDDGTFSLVTSRFSLFHLGEPGVALREMLRVCEPFGRVVIADLVRPNLAGPERDKLERMRDPDHPGTPSIAKLTELITGAGADIRRLDVFTIERPAATWLAGVPEAAARRIRRAFIDEVDGGPKTGGRPRVIGGELWFTQCWAHVAAQPLKGSPHPPVGSADRRRH